MHSAGRNFASLAANLSDGISVVRNYSVDMSTNAKPALSSSTMRAARKLLEDSSSIDGLMIVPGLTTRMISLLVKPFVVLGSSTWSHIAILCPALMSLER